MFRKRRLLFGLIIMLLAVPVLAQEDPVVPESTDAFWEAAYWNNQTLAGEPTVRRAESLLEHDWGRGTPWPGIPGDHFSARWTRTIEVPQPGGGTYRFVATSDDGIRVWVDEALIIDKWHDHAVETYTAELILSPGHHQIRVEYYENGGEAVASLEFYNVGGGFVNWRGAYYDNRWLSGNPVVVRDDRAIDFNWGFGAAAQALPSNQFSARWTRQLSVDDLTAGRWRFTATADDGIRVWVDGNLVISEWSEHPAQRFTADVTLGAGIHELKVEYFENRGLAVAQLAMTPVRSDAPAGWFGQYFANRNLDHGGHSPTYSRFDPAIDFNWENASPSGLPNDDFSVRWTRTVKFDPGIYRFTVRSDDGVRLWVNGNLLIDRWVDQANETHTASMQLSGPAVMRLEYYEHGGSAAVRFGWERMPDPPPAAAVVTVDNGDSGFQVGGDSGDWKTVYEGMEGDLLWSRNSESATGNYNWARWYPQLPAGRYEVHVYIPDRYTTTANARYWISHRDGDTLQTVDQSQQGGRWVSLGTYWFAGGYDEYVSLSDVTFEAGFATLVAFDAVRWTPR